MQKDFWISFSKNNVESNKIVKTFFLVSDPTHEPSHLLVDQIHMLRLV